MSALAVNVSRLSTYWESRRLGVESSTRGTAEQQSTCCGRNPSSQPDYHQTNANLRRGQENAGNDENWNEERHTTDDTPVYPKSPKVQPNRSLDPLRDPA
jgi:hypothetical protein